jgi:cation:H+ antiporter
MLLQSSLLFLAGFVILIKGADWLVDGACSLAKRLRISDLLVGLTIVAFGTSAPELFVNIFASMRGNADIAIGNILGSNTANVLLILGASAVIHPLMVHKKTVWREIPFALLAAVVILILGNDTFLDGTAWSGLSRTDGLILIAFFSIFLHDMFYRSKIEPDITTESMAKVFPMGKTVILIILGLIGLVLGADWVVDSAVSIAEGIGVSKALIGLTIVAVGTSLPELVTSTVAAYRGNTDIAVGNIVGSNIFNIFWILGLSASIRPLPFSPSANPDIGLVILSSFLLFLFTFLGKRHHVSRNNGLCFLILYAAYFVFLVLRG